MRPRWFQWRALSRPERSWAIGLCLLLSAFLALAWAVMAGHTTVLDSSILASLRHAGDLSTPNGPAWIKSAMLDLTALGSTTVLGLIVFAVAGYLTFRTRYRTALALLLTAASGDLANRAIKEIIMRPRPTVVPHLRDVLSYSFPSGHASVSAIVYLTLGAMLMRLTGRRSSKAYCMGTAIVVTGLVGVSRVCLGVHYPTDVIGGWMFGVLWASSCWIVLQPFGTHAGVRPWNPDDRGKDDVEAALSRAEGETRT